MSIKNFFKYIFVFFIFILNLFLNTFAADLNISSISYDNSNAILSINSKDNTAYSFTEYPKLYMSDDGTKAYFDINSALLTTNISNLSVNSSAVKEISIIQLSKNPNVVRVLFECGSTFSSKTVQVKQVGNTVVVNLGQLSMQNYYFQHNYSDFVSNTSKHIESTIVKTPVQMENNVANQINSAFKLVSDTNNYVLAKKELKLLSDYYVEDLTVKNNIPMVSGMGNAMLIKPMYLANPRRIAYDLPNTIVKPSLRNQEFSINGSDTIKIGQFDSSTARVVITSDNSDKYIPVVMPDSQRIMFINKNVAGIKSYAIHSTLNSVNLENANSQTQALKLVFSKPVVYGIERNDDDLSLYLYNVDKSQEFNNFKQSVIFKNSKISAFNEGLKLTIPVLRNDLVDIHFGTDGKTLRVKVKTERVVTQPQQKTVVEKVNVEPVVISKPKVNRNKNIVVIDAGHGGTDCGATRNNIYEKDITLDVSKRVEKMLKSKGYEVVMTRTNDTFVSLQGRVDISEAVEPDIFVSIHVNSSNSDSPKGIETHYYKDNSLQLAKVIHASMHNNINTTDRGLFKSKFYVINHTTAPAILVEIGFISNPTERGQLVSDSRKQATAKAIAEGIYDYFK